MLGRWCNILICLFVWTQWSICVVSIGNLTEFIPLCAGAKDTNFTVNTNYYCTLVHWTTANLYERDGFSRYNPGQALSITEQDAVAKVTAAGLLGLSKKSEACERVIKWYACLQTFPYCPLSSQSVSTGTSYMPPCQIHCDHIRQLCGLQSNELLNCNRATKSKDNKNCMLYVPANYLLLPPDRGPYEGLPLFYATMLGVWILTTCLWLYVCSIWRNSPNPALLRLISIAFFCRIGLSVIARLFWVDCNETQYYCPVGSIYNTTPAFRILEASQFFLFFIMSKGWTITKPNLATSEWFMAQLVTLAYLFVSFSFSEITYHAPNVSWIVFTCILYAYVYVQIMGLCWAEVQLLRSQVKRLNTTIAEERMSAITMKLEMYQQLMIVVTTMTLLELICQILFASPTVPTLAVAVVYEISSWIILVAVAYVFRPRELSPFFYMVPTTHLHHDQHRNDQPRPLSIVSVKNTFLSKKENAETTTQASAVDHNLDEIEVELSPLLPPVSNVRNPEHNAGDSIVVINRDDGEMALGVHITRPARTEDDRRMLHGLNLFQGRNNANRVVPRNF